MMVKMKRNLNTINALSSALNLISEKRMCVPVLANKSYSRRSHDHAINALEEKYKEENKE